MIAVRASDATELVVRYEPMHGMHQDYEVGIYRTGKRLGTPGDVVSVRCATGGYTSWHQRYVDVPRVLEVSKSGQDTAITLRKNGDRIAVVGLR